MSNQANDCCWIILATTGCTTSSAAMPKSKASLGANATDGCCWILVATTACTTSNITSSPKVQNVADDCCWIVLATTGCSTS